MLRTQMYALAVPGAEENLLGEGRPVIRRMSFIANDREPTVESVTTQRFGGAQSGSRSADDDDPIARTHEWPLLVELDSERRARGGGLTDFVVQLRRRIIVEHHDLPIVVDVEDTRANEDALTGTDARLCIRPNLHNSPSIHPIFRNSGLRR
jgi:hypothetical protein